MTIDYKFGYEEAQRLGDKAVPLREAQDFLGLPKGSYEVSWVASAESIKERAREQKFSKREMSVGADEKANRIINALELERINEMGFL